MRRFVAPLAVAAVALAAPAPTYACSCVGSSEDELRRAADVVFVGRVERVAPRGVASVRARLRVQRVVKGRLASRRVTVETPPNEAACGVEFRRGTRVRVYAQREGGGLTTGLCDGTRRVGSAAAACA